MGQGDGWLRSFDCRTGDLIWKFDINFKSPEQRFRLSGPYNCFLASPVFHENRIYIDPDASTFGCSPKMGKLRMAELAQRPIESLSEFVRVAERTAGAG